MVYAGHAVRRRELQQQLQRAFRTAGAVSPDRARTLVQLGLTESDEFRAYRRNRIVREVKPGEFYFDEDAAKEHDMMIVRLVLLPGIGLTLALLLFAIAVNK